MEKADGNLINLLLLNKDYVEKIKEHNLLTAQMLDNDDLRNE